MVRLILIVGVLTFNFSICAWAESPSFSYNSGRAYYESCTGGKITSLSNQIASAIPPFSEECGKSAWTQNRPLVGQYGGTIPPYHDLINGGGRVKTKDVLLQALAKIRAYNELNIELNDEFLNCLSNRKVGGENCKDDLDYVDKIVPIAVSQARAHLGRAFNKTIMEYGYGEWAPNPNLNPFGSFRGEPWVPLDQAESAAALKDVANRVKRAKILWEVEKNNPKANVGGRFLFLERQLQSEASAHFEEYQNLLSENPYLLYMTGAFKSKSKNPTEAERKAETQRLRSEFANALRSLNKNTRDSQAELDKIEAKLKASPENEIPTEALEILKYRSLIRGMLREDEKMCGLVQSLEQVRQGNRNRDEKIAMAGLIALSFGGPAIILRLGLGAGMALTAGSAINAASTAAYVYRDCKNRDRAVLRNAKAIDRATDPTSNGQADIDFNQQMCSDSMIVGPAVAVVGEAIPIVSYLRRAPTGTRVPARSSLPDDIQ